MIMELLNVFKSYFFLSSTFKAPPVRRHYQLRAGPGSWVTCTGALLDPTHVLTAGHCVNQSRSYRSFNFGIVTR